jgi:hypothetical protein
MQPSNESSGLSSKYYFHIQVKDIFDFLIADVSRRRERLQEASLDFEFLSSPSLENVELTELKRAANNLGLKWQGS